MRFRVESVNKISIHMTNINGLGVGATRLLDSLLPSLIDNYSRQIVNIYADSYYKAYLQNEADCNVVYYRRFLFNFVSRFLECTLFGRKFDGESILLVMGDLPIMTKSKQIVFVQNPHLVRAANRISFEEIKYIVMRAIVKINKKYCCGFIVQTQVMKESLSRFYDIPMDHISVVPQPVPLWLMGYKSTPIDPDNCRKLRLFYPAKAYPHKGHSILSKLHQSKGHLPVESLVLTVDESQCNYGSLDFVKCIGICKEEEMIDYYLNTHALLFLSEFESYGFPLIEAMYLGLPIICPSEPYAKTLCGDQAIYFELGSAVSLRAAIYELSNRIENNYMPDWSNQLSSIPNTWADVANKMVQFTQIKASEHADCI